MDSVRSFISSKSKKDKAVHKELSKPAEKQSALVTNESDVKDDVMYVENELISETDTDTGKIRFQRNVPGRPTIWEGHEVGSLKNVLKNKKGMINFHTWEMTRQAVLLCPSTKKGLMPMRKELQFIFPRAVWGVDGHGGYIEVARKLGLKPHRIPPYYIPYLEPEEQFEFVQSQIDKYNEIRSAHKNY